MLQYLIIYLIGINLFTYIAFYVDKKKAQKGKRRISEKELLQLSLIGGIIGALFAMKNFRHKTQKKSFYNKIYSILLLYICLILYIVYKLFIEG
ncbi:MAG: DUF1294 domain-containing protein [Clostridiales bacterium]|nr:DUF1294 domain-containing protein [Clostridiales bacterium]